MKKILLSTIATLAVCGSAMAADRVSVLDPTYRAKEGVVAANFDVFLRTGETKSGDHMTNISASTWEVGDANFAYGLTDRWMLTAKVAGNNVNALAVLNPAYNDGNAQIGIDYQVLPGKEFGINLFGKLGLGLTKDTAAGGVSIPLERNDVTFGAKFFGASGQFAWGVTAAAYYALESELKTPAKVTLDDRMDLLLSLEALYSLNKDWALKAQFDLRMYGEQESNTGMNIDSFEDMALTFGAVYSVKNVAIMPYFKYHFENELGNADMGDDYYQIGMKIGFDF